MRVELKRFRLSNDKQLSWQTNRTVCQFPLLSLTQTSVPPQPNGELTLDENLSDHDGLALAWRTYHRWQRRHDSAPEPRLPGVQGSVRQTFLLALAQVSGSV